MTEIPLVSVIVPCYNQAQYLPDALESVLNQTYNNWECIIVNDGSPDDTERVAAEWCQRDSRFQYLKKENGGLSSARNAGIAASVGTYILPLDADDRIGKHYLNLSVQAFIDRPHLKLVYCNARYFGIIDQHWPLPEFSLRKLALQNIIFCSAVYKRDDFNKYGPYDESFTTGREDWDFWLSLIKQDTDVHRLESVEFFYRKKEGGSMIDLMNNEKQQTKTAINIFIKHQELYLRLFGDPITAFRERENYKKALDSLKSSRWYKVATFLKLQSLRMNSVISKRKSI